MQVPNPIHPGAAANDPTPIIPDNGSGGGPNWRPVVGKILLIVLGLGLFWGVCFALPGHLALAAYHKRINNSKTASFSGNLTVNGKDFFSQYSSNLNFSGSYDQTDPTVPAGQAQFHGTFATKQYDGQAVIKDGQAYVNLHGPDMPILRYRQSPLTYRIHSDNWYQLSLDRTLFDDFCQADQSGTFPQPQLYNRITGMIKLNDPFFAGGGRVDGHWAVRYHGSVDSSSLAAAVKELGKEFPQQCSFPLKDFDFRLLHLSYDLWTANGYDKLQVSYNQPLLGGSAKWSVATTDYGKPVNITVPDGAINLNQLWQRLIIASQVRASVEQYKSQHNGLLPVNLDSLHLKVSGSLQGINYNVSKDGKNYRVDVSASGLGTGVTANSPL